MSPVRNHCFHVFVSKIYMFIMSRELSWLATILGRKWNFCAFEKVIASPVLRLNAFASKDAISQVSLQDISSFLPAIMLCGKKIDTNVVLGYLKIDRKSQRSLSCIMLEKLVKVLNGFVVKVVSLWSATCANPSWWYSVVETLRTQKPKCLWFFWLW